MEVNKSQEEHNNCNRTACVLEKAIPEVNVGQVPSFDFGNALASKYPLLRLIFDYLSYEDLKNCATINELWSTYASEAIDTKYLKPGFFSFIKTATRGNFVLESTGNTSSNISCALVFCKKSFQNFYRRKFICFQKGESFQSKEARTIIDNMLVGKNVPFLMCYCTELLTSDDPYKPIAMRGTLIPYLPNAIIKRFCCPEWEIARIVRKEIYQRNLHIRALFIFDTAYHKNTTFSFVYDCIKEQKTKFPICGGTLAFCESNASWHEMKKWNGMGEITHCIAIALPRESRDFEAYSGLFLENLYDPTEFFQRLKEKVTLKKHSFAVCCFCLALAINIDWGELFRTHFPDTPVTCLGVSEEYGWDSMNVGDEENIDLTSIHQFTCVVAILTWD